MIIIKKVYKTKWNNKIYKTYKFRIISKKHDITYDFKENKTLKEVIKWHMIEKNMMPLF